MAWVMAGATLLCAGTSLAAEEAAPAKVNKQAAALVSTALPKLEALAGNKDVVAEVLKRNAESMTDALASSIQARWLSADPKDAEFCKPYLENAGSKWLKTSLNAFGMSKAFSCDKNGNVASTAPKCHDYLHGTQDKFKDPFNSGKTVVNKPAKDLTSHKYSVQVSVPIKHEGKTVGVLVGTFGLE
jgi:hypothetical protein